MLSGPARSSYAQGGGQTKPDPSAKEAERFGSPLDPNASARGRVNLSTGNAYEQKEDLSVPGRGLPLRFERTYHSLDTYSGPLGYGWSHSFDASLKENSDGSVAYSGPQGARKNFARNPDGSYAPPKALHDQLTKASDGSFKLKSKHGLQRSFDKNGASFRR